MWIEHQKPGRPEPKIPATCQGLIIKGWGLAEAGLASGGAFMGGHR